MSVLWWIATVAFATYVWDLLVSLGGLLPFPRAPVPDGHLRFVILVPGHDEAHVIASTVEGLLALDYPRDRFAVYVIADNCSDDTAERARVAGARVLERSHPTKRAKGYAVEWAIAQVTPDGPWDALCIFDADNRVAPNFLTEMNARLAAGDVAVQAYLDTKNPDESWVSRCIALAYSISGRFWFRARARVGLSTTLGGTGFAIRWDIVKRFGWDPGCLTDDLEMTQNLLLAGHRVHFTPHTRTFDEKPLKLGPSVRQRGRWMQGHLDVAVRFFGRLVWQGVRRPSIRCLDAALYLLQPLRTLIAFVTMCVLIVAWIAGGDLGQPIAVDIVGWTLVGVIFGVYPLLLAVMERVPARRLLWLPVFFLYSFSWIPAIAKGMLRFRRREWAHTAHGDAARATKPSA